MSRLLVRPRLSDAFDLAIPQQSVDFAIPYLYEDRRFCLDPFLMWKSAKADYQAQHQIIERFVDLVRESSVNGKVLRASKLLTDHFEAQELGLGYGSGSREGTSIGPRLARRIILTFQGIPQLQEQGFEHLETLGLLVPGVAEDRLSDLTAGLIGDWLISFTQQQAELHGIPQRETTLRAVWDGVNECWTHRTTTLPWNPVDDRAVLLAPLDLMRKLPWINYEDYYKTEYHYLLPGSNIAARREAKEAVLAFNRDHYQQVQQYISRREEEGLDDAEPHPLFQPLQLPTLRKKFAELRALPIGREDGADRKFEVLASDLLSSLLWPELDFAKMHARTDSGAHIVDAIFHNDGTSPFLTDLRDRHQARQIVWELKNVERLQTEHVNQLYRYLDETETGRVGILLTRNPAPANVVRNAVDLHSAKRYFILCADDRDIGDMLALAESGYRPVEILRKLYVEFVRRLPR